MRLENINGDLVILEEGRLDSWTREHGLLDSNSNYYRRGEAREIPTAGGGNTSELLGQKADGGWGTYFRPNTRTTYKLTVEVVQPEPVPLPARVNLAGW
jgi:hypothetical protein